MPSVDAFVDGLGGVVIGLAAAIAGGIAHARSSPTAIATLVICGLILSPFVIELRSTNAAGNAHFPARCLCREDLLLSTSSFLAQSPSQSARF